MAWSDIAYALRTARSTPAFTAAAVISIALGLAANTTVFSMVNATLLGALPVRDPSGLYALGGGKTFPLPDYRDFRDQSGSFFEGLAGSFPLAPASLATDGAPPERIWGALVTGNYFSVVGPPLAIGRGIGPADDAPAGGNSVAVLSDALWRRRFGADPQIVGKAAVLNGHRSTIVGVMARQFHGSERGIVSEFWAPIAMRGDFLPDIAKDAEKRNTHWIVIVGRLRPGVSKAEATAAINVIDARIYDAHRKKDRRREPLTIAKAGGLLGGETRMVGGLMAMLMVVVGLVLLIACANVANLLLARAVERQREIGIRLAVGASRGRLIRQLLTESVALAAMGAAAGFGLAFAAARALSNFQLPIPVPFALDFTPDLRVLGFTAALTLATGVLFGVAPAFVATRMDLVSALKRAQTGYGIFRLFGMRNLLVGLQVALSTVLLIAAGLFVRSLGSAASLNLGIRPERVLLMAVDPKTAGYSNERLEEFLRQLETRVTALPGVESAAAVNILPLSLAENGSEYRDAAGGDKAAKTAASEFAVTSGFFRTLGIPLMRGRSFQATDVKTSLAVINQTMARRLYGEANPIGRVIRSGDKRFEVIGVVGDSKAVTLGEEVKACAYFYLPRDAGQVLGLLGMTILVKTSGDPAAMTRTVRDEILKLDPTLAVFNVDTMTRHVSKAFLIPRVCATLFGVFGVVGLALAAVGLFGVVSYSVRSRTREIGIRIAVGARPAEILRLVVGQGLGIVAVSLALGLTAAWGLSRFTATMLYGISATDAITFIATPLVLLGSAVVAIVAPARRACSIRPMDALRLE